MSLLAKILSYSKDTKQIRDAYDDKVARLKSEYDAYILNCDKDIKKLESDIADLEKTSDVIKANLKVRIGYESRLFVYESMKDDLDAFGLKEILNSESGIPNKNLDELKNDLRRTLVSIKEIKTVTIPSIEEKKKIAKEKLAADLDKANTDKTNDVDKIRNPLLEEFNSQSLRRLFDYTTDLTPYKADSLPDKINLGNYVINNTGLLNEITSENPILIPYEIEARESANIVLKIDSNHLYDNNGFIENVLTGLTMRYIESFPSGHLKIGIYSSSITSFGKLSALFAASVKGKISLTNETSKTRDQFAKLLISVSEKGEIINSKLLENSCSNLYELYEKGITTEDFQLVVVHDAFRDMTLDSINQLHGCISELSRCGIRFIIIDDFTDEIYKNKSSAFMSKLNQILDSCYVFEIDGTECKDQRQCKVDFIKTTKVQNSFIFEFINKYCTYASEKKAPYLSYERVGFGKETSNKDNFESIIVPVALNEPDVWNIEFDCVGHSPNANLIVGIPGTGKSTLIDSLIMNGSMKYSPDELLFQLLDFKDGISSSVYTMPECKIPNIKVVSQNNKPEEAEIILSNILSESERRNKEFVSLRNETGEAIRNIVEYNKLVSTGKYNRKNMPRLIIVIDECQYLFEDESLAKKCQDIVRKCRSQGIHLILATQTLSHKMWGTVKFVEGIYCFEIAKDDAEQLLQRKYAQLISTEIPKGSYMAFASNNGGNECTKIRVAYDGGNTSKYSKQICEKWSSYPLDMVVIGDKSPKYITIKDYLSLVSSESSEIPIGENYNNHQTLKISYTNKRPLFLAGTSQKAADSILKLIAFAAGEKKIKTYVVDASSKQTLKQFLCTKEYKQTSVGDETNYMPYLQEVYSVYKSRESNIRGTNTPIFFIINGLQNIVDFLNNKKSDTTSSEDEFDKTNMSIKDIVAMMSRKKDNNGNVNLPVNGRETLIPLLMNNAYKANIFICVSLDTISLTNDSGEQVFGYGQRNIIRLSDYKILYPNCSSDIKNIMDDSFKDKMLNGLSNDMAFISVEQRDFYKFRFYQLLEEGDQV